MFLCEEIQKLITKNRTDKIQVFVDMDGVIADYRFGEGTNIKNNKRGTYINKRPIFTCIYNLEVIKKQHKLELCILSSCLFQEQVDEKNEWLDKYASFFKKENRFFVLPKDFDGRRDMKIDKLINIIAERTLDRVILIDDTHEILFEAISRLEDKVIPFHISTLID